MQPTPVRLFSTSAPVCSKRLELMSPKLPNQVTHGGTVPLYCLPSALVALHTSVATIA